MQRYGGGAARLRVANDLKLVTPHSPQEERYSGVADSVPGPHDCRKAADAVLTVHGNVLEYHDGSHRELRGELRPGWRIGTVGVTDGALRLSGTFGGQEFAGRLSDGRCDYALRLQPGGFAPPPEAARGEPDAESQVAFAIPSVPPEPPPVRRPPAGKLKSSHRTSPKAVASAPADASQLPTYELLEPMFAEAPTASPRAAEPTPASTPIAAGPRPAPEQPVEPEPTSSTPAAAEPAMTTMAALPPQPAPTTQAGDTAANTAGDRQVQAIDTSRLAIAEDLILARAATSPGSEVLQPLAAAIGPLQAAAQRGDPAAAYDVGYCYEHGIGVKADPVKAYAYYIRSAGAPAPLKVRSAAFSGAQGLIARLTNDQYNAARQMLQTESP